MCKIAAVSGVDDKNRDGVWEFMIRLGRYMSYANSDGLGYAAFDKNYNIFGERWLINDHAFRPEITIPDNKYNWFGKDIRRNEARSIILHTRMATCGKGMENTHPFIDTLDGSPNLALIHNGIIRNHNQLTKKFSTCDSEVILHEYDNENVKFEPKNLKSVFSSLDGWFACAVLAKTKDGGYLDIFTDGTSVNSYYIEDFGVRIFSTSEADIKAVAAAMKLSIKNPIRLPENAYRRYGLGGELLTSGILDLKKQYNPQTWNSWEENEILEYWENFLNGRKM
jgi:predicted glutamine amidotransferase